MVDEGSFLEDLLYRIDVLQLTAPPLRDRTEDIPLLAKLFIEKFAEDGEWEPLKISRGAMAILK